MSFRLDRRAFLSTTTAAGISAATLPHAIAAEATPQPTDFRIACMTLPFSKLPLQTALSAIADAGYSNVAWGTTHQEESGRQPVIAADAAPKTATELGKRCRDLGLEPVMMFSGIYPEHPQGLQVLTQRLKQAAAGGVGQVLTFGHTKGGNREIWIERFKKLGPIARDLGVVLVVKQHGGSTGTGEACAKIVREVDDAGVMVNYDAGNVMDYLNVDPIPDIEKCAAEVRSFCIKDHRNWPRDQDCGPGLGEIDHYRLLDPVARTGRKMPLCCENIFAPLVERPTTAKEIGGLAKRARIFLETVVAGLHAQKPTDG